MLREEQQSPPLPVSLEKGFPFIPLSVPSTFCYGQKRKYLVALSHGAQHTRNPPELYCPIHMLTLSNTNANWGTDTVSLQRWSQKGPTINQTEQQPDASRDRNRFTTAALSFIVAAN